MKWLKQERGFSLVEVLASILLITVILFSFSSIFLQTKKTNVSAEEIHDAVYLAQTEMERIYTFFYWIVENLPNALL